MSSTESSTYNISQSFKNLFIHFAYYQKKKGKGFENKIQNHEHSICDDHILDTIVLLENWLIPTSFLIRKLLLNLGFYESDKLKVYKHKP